MKKKNKEVLAKLKGEKLCPFCHEPAKKVGICSGSTVQFDYRLRVRRNALIYRETDREEKDHTGFYCCGCLTDLDLNECEVVEILKKS